VKMKRGGGPDATPTPTLEPFNSNDTRSGPDGFLYHVMTLRSGSQAVVTRFQLPEGLSDVKAYFRSGRAPTSGR
jgi:hypothetical protein